MIHRLWFRQLWHESVHFLCFVSVAESRPKVMAEHTIDMSPLLPTINKHQRPVQITFSSTEEDQQSYTNHPGKTRLSDLPPTEADNQRMTAVGPVGSVSDNSATGMHLVVLRWKQRGKRRVILPLLKFGCQRCMQTMKQRYYRHFRAGVQRRGQVSECC